MGRARAYARARRHTRWVKVLRLGLPLSAVALVAAIVAPLFLDVTADLPAVDVAGFGLTGTGITMQRPRLTGFSEDRRPYEIAAERAEQNLATPDNLGLFGITARMETSGGGWADLTAHHGLLDSKTQLLDLDQEIRLKSDKGDGANLSRARVAFTSGDIISDAPVDLTSGTMNLKANSMRVTEGGDLAVFEGQVVMMLYPKSDDAQEINR
jgi:lipopolysaccharide export system protein LptC